MSCRGGVGHLGIVCHAGVGRGGSCRGGVDHSGVNWENNRCYSYLSQMQNDVNWCRGGVGWGESCRGGVGDTGVEWAVKNFTE